MFPKNGQSFYTTSPRIRLRFWVDSSGMGFCFLISTV